MKNRERRDAVGRIAKMNIGRWVALAALLLVLLALLGQYTVLRHIP